ncbi:uncharacterized protein LOC111704324 isoform X2 [Eurytemora carolleeae]|nr:uncharacterized protein LOC111704324 isoform X2 [Eurytemora carolleeae]|eukprot:XP_023332323.1 uncharacterized protein LOC111704324 isoform X2 [Eurytemora affinis]
MRKTEEENGGFGAYSNLPGSKTTLSLGLVSSKSWCGPGENMADSKGSCVGLSRWEAGEEKNSLLGDKGGSWLRVHSTTRSMRNLFQSRNEKLRNNCQTSDISSHEDSPVVSPNSNVPQAWTNFTNAITQTEIQTVLGETCREAKKKKRVSILESNEETDYRLSSDPISHLQDVPLKSALKPTKYDNDLLIDITNGQNNGKLNIRENPLQLFSDNSGYNDDDCGISFEVPNLALSSSLSASEHLKHQFSPCCWDDDHRRIDNEVYCSDASNDTSETVNYEAVTKEISKADQIFTSFLILATLLCVIYLFYSQNTTGAFQFHQ